MAFKAVTGYLPSGSDTDELEKQEMCIRDRLNTVADYIVLISFYCQRILIFESVHTALRH